MHPDRRSSARERLVFPITLEDGSAALTRDISADGLFFTLPVGHAVPGWMRIEFDIPQAALKFTAAGEVVRIDRGEHEDGVAVRLHAQRLFALK